MTKKRVARDPSTLPVTNRALTPSYSRSSALVRRRIQSAMPPSTTTAAIAIATIVPEPPPPPLDEADAAGNGLRVAEGLEEVLDRHRPVSAALAGQAPA